MGFRIGDVYLALLADDARLKPEVEKAAAEAGDAGAKTLGQRLKAGLTPERIGTALGAAFGGAAVAAARMGDKVDDAYDRIRVGTGATGDALRGLEDDFKAVSSRVPDDLSDVGQVIADLNTRTGQTGEGLQDLATTILDFSRLTKSDVNTNVRNATRLFGDWSIAVEDQAGTLDKVYRASQATGIGVDDLMQKVVDFGSPLRLLGFSFEDSIALLSKWEKEGVNTETALAGLKYGVKTLASEGVDAADMGQELKKRLDAIKSSADPVGESIKLFGLRAGPDLAAAIVEGRFATEDLVDVIENGSDTIQQATEDTQDFGDQIKKWSNGIQANLGGLFTAFAGLGNLVYLIPAITGGIGRALGAAWTKAAGSAVVTGAIASAGSVASTVYLKALIASDVVVAGLSGLWAKAVTSVPLLGAISKAGASIGAALATSVVAALAAGIGAFFAGIQISQWIKDQSGMSEEEWQAQVYGNYARMGGRDLPPDVKAANTSIGQHITRDLGRGITEAAPVVEKAGDDMMARFRAVVPGSAGKDAGQQIPRDIATGISERQTFVQSAMNNLRNLMENVLGRRKRIGLVIGDLISTDLQDALVDKRWRVRNAAEQTQEALIAELAKAISKGGKVGREAEEALAKALNSKDPKVRAAAQHVKEIVDGRLDKVVTSAGNAGQDAGEAFASRLRRAIAAGDFTVNASVGFSLPGRAAGGPVTAGIPYLVNERTPRSEVFVPKVDGNILTHAQRMRAIGAAAGGGGDTINLNVPITGYLKAETPGEVAGRLRQIAASGVITNPRRRRRVEVGNA